MVFQILGKAVKLKKTKQNPEAELRADSPQWAWLGADLIPTLSAA